MGLSNSSGAFLAVMSKVFQDKQKFKYLFAYVDDISIASGTFSEHLHHLDTVFSTIRQNSLRLNPTKTILAQPEIKSYNRVFNDRLGRTGGWPDKPYGQNPNLEFPK